MRKTITNNKQAYIDFILNELNKGNVKYNDVSSLFCSKFQITERTFNKYWLLSNEVHLEQRQAINAEKLNTTIQTEKESTRRLVLDKIGRMLIAEEIAMGKAKKVEGQIIMPSFSERIRALDYLSKIEGDFAPQQIEHDVKEISIQINRYDSKG
jgi:hypothetical protein